MPNSRLVSRGVPQRQRIRTLDVFNQLLKISRRQKNLSIILTHRCNLSCAYCLRDANPDCKSEIPFSRLKKIILAAHRFGVRSAGITGGEPFLYPGWEKLIKLTGSLRWRVLWETNGVFVDEKRLQFLEHNLGKNISFLVSLDSQKEKIHDKLRGKGSFKKALRAIKLIKAYGFSLETNVVFTPFNLVDEKSLIAYVDFNKKLGVDSLNFNRAVNLGRGANQTAFRISEKEMAKLNFLFKKHNYFNGYLKGGAFRYVEDDVGCERLGSEICVSPFGVHPCVFHENIKLGELKDFPKIFFNQLFLKTLNILRLASISAVRGRYFSCADCMESLPVYLKAVKQLELTEGVIKIKDKETEAKEKVREKIIHDNNGIILPADFSVLMTQKCNLNCDFCEFECSPRKTAEIDIEDFEKLLYEGRNIGVSRIIFDGGEPLIHSRIKEAMRLCCRYGYDVMILTNGRYFQKYLPEFKKYNIRKFIFGINGATAKISDAIAGKRGSFEKTVKAIKKSKESGFFTGLHFAIHPLNIMELDRFFGLAKKWKVDYIMTSRISEGGRAKGNPGVKINPNQIEEVRKVYQKHRNFLGRIQFSGSYVGDERSAHCRYLARDGSLSVHWNGEIALCSMTPLLNLPFKKIRDYSLLECLALMNETNRKFQQDRNREFSSRRLAENSENPYFSCEYCHQCLAENRRKYFAG